MNIDNLAALPYNKCRFGTAVTVEDYAGNRSVTTYDNKGTPNLTGTAAADSIEGTAKADNIDAFAGNDTINGLAGNDTLYGGDDNDYLDGGVGNGSMFGDAGVDTLYGGVGNDTMEGGVGKDTFLIMSNNDGPDAGSDLGYPHREYWCDNQQSGNRIKNFKELLL